MTPKYARHEPTNVSTLARAEQVFLWSMRIWYSSPHNPISTRPVLRELFEHEGIAAGLDPFENLMLEMFHGLTDWPDIRCVHSAHVGRQELQLLTALSHLQRHQEIGARRELRIWLRPAAVSAVIRHATVCVQHASAAGLILATPERLDTIDANTQSNAQSGGACRILRLY